MSSFGGDLYVKLGLRVFICVTHVMVGDDTLYVCFLINTQVQVIVQVIYTSKTRSNSQRKANIN